MNILTDEEIKKVHDADLYLDFHDIARAIESAVLSKLAEQDMEPVGWLCNGELYEVRQYRLFPRDEPIQGQEKLYTETQLIAAQQRTAEACAKAVFEQAKYFGYNVHAEAVRDAALNNWREYL